MSTSTNSKERQPCEAGQIILREGESTTNQMLATQGDFLVHINRKDGKYRRVMLLKSPSLFCLSRNTAPEISPHTVTSLSTGEVTTISTGDTRDKSLPPTDEALVKAARLNDKRSLTWQIAALRHVSLNKRIRDLLNLLTENGKHATPIMTQESLANLVGFHRNNLSQEINRLKRAQVLEGGNASLDIPYSLTKLGQETFFTHNEYLDPLNNDIAFWKNYAPSLKGRLQLLDARQAGSKEERFAYCLWLLSDCGLKPTPRLHQRDLGRLSVVSRQTVNSLAEKWEALGRLTRQGVRGTIYKLEEPGKKYIEDILENF